MGLPPVECLVEGPGGQGVWSRSQETMASMVRRLASSLASAMSPGSSGTRDAPAPLGSETASTQACIAALASSSGTWESRSWISRCWNSSPE